MSGHVTIHVSNSLSVFAISIHFSLSTTSQSMSKKKKHFGIVTVSAEKTKSYYAQVTKFLFEVDILIGLTRI